MITAVQLPESIDAARTSAANGGWIMGGGTIIMALVNNQHVGPSEIVSLHKAGLSAIGQLEEGIARVGATTTMAQIEESPVLEFLSTAMRSFAAPSIRNMATVGGNLFAAQPYGDLAACLLALGADVEVAGVGGFTLVPVHEVLDKGVAPGEFVTAVQFTVPQPGTWRYHKAMRRKFNSAAIITVAAMVDTVEGKVTHARIVLGGVGPRPLRSSAAEAAILGRELTSDVVDDAAEAAQSDIFPSDDAYASAWYRRRVLSVHLRRALLG